MQLSVFYHYYFRFSTDNFSNLRGTLNVELYTMSFSLISLTICAQKFLQLERNVFYHFKIVLDRT